MSKLDIMLTFPEATELSLVLNKVTILTWKGSIFAFFFYKFLIFTFFTLTFFLHTCLKLPLNPSDAGSKLQTNNIKSLPLVPAGQVLLQNL